MLSKDITTVFQRFLEANPDPKTELKYKNKFQLLISVMLSAQATDIAVNKITPELFKQAATPAAMVKLGVPKIKQLIKSIGLYNTKAENIYKSCQILLEKHNGEIPKQRADLQKLAGVGAKTAAVVLNVAYQLPYIPVDTHVFRVSNRIGLVQTKTAEKTETELLKVVPDWAKSRAHHWLILHGRYTCKARKPLCNDCKITSLCQYFKNLK